MLREFRFSVFLQNFRALISVYVPNKYYSSQKIFVKQPRVNNHYRIYRDLRFKNDFRIFARFRFKSFSRIWAGANICSATKANGRVFLSRTFAHFSTTAPETFSQHRHRLVPTEGTRLALSILRKLLRGISVTDVRTIETQITMNDYITSATAATLELVGRVLPSILCARVWPTCDDGKEHERGGHASLKRQQSCLVDARGESELLKLRRNAKQFEPSFDSF